MNNDLLKKIGDRIARVRKIRNLTQANLAEELGMTASAFSKIESGKNNTPIKRLVQIAEVLEVEVSEFLENKRIVAEPRGSYEYAAKDDFDALKRVVEVLVKKIDERLPEKNENKAYLNKAKKLKKNR